MSEWLAYYEFEYQESERRRLGKGNDEVMRGL